MKKQVKTLTLTAKDELKNVHGGSEPAPELLYDADKKQTGPR